MVGSSLCWSMFNKWFSRNSKYGLVAFGSFWYNTHHGQFQATYVMLLHAESGSEAWLAY